MILYKTYNKEEYPTYDNYDAIDVYNVGEIPDDYKGVMGVPITFLDKYNPEQFEIICSDYEIKQGFFSQLLKQNWKGKIDKGYINGKRIYARILIKNKKL